MVHPGRFGGRGRRSGGVAGLALGARAGSCTGARRCSSRGNLHHPSPASRHIEPLGWDAIPSSNPAVRRILSGRRRTAGRCPPCPPAPWPVVIGASHPQHRGRDFDSKDASGTALPDSVTTRPGLPGPGRECTRLGPAVRVVTGASNPTIPDTCKHRSQGLGKGGCAPRPDRHQRTGGSGPCCGPMKRPGTGLSSARLPKESTVPLEGRGARSPSRIGPLLGCGDESPDGQASGVTSGLS